MIYRNNVRLRIKFRCLKTDLLKRAFEVQLGEKCLAYCGKLMEIQDLPYKQCQENHASSSQFPSKPSFQWEELDLHPRSIPKSIKTINTSTYQLVHSSHSCIFLFCNPVLESRESMRVLYHSGEEAMNQSTSHCKSTVGHWSSMGCERITWARHNWVLAGSLFSWVSTARA